MKILNAQSAVLSNYEVYAHLMSKREASLLPASGSISTAGSAPGSISTAAALPPSKKAQQNRERDRERPQQRRLKAPNYEAVSREILEYLSPGSSTTMPIPTPTTQTTSKHSKPTNQAQAQSQSQPQPIIPVARPSSSSSSSSSLSSATPPPRSDPHAPLGRTFPLPPYASRAHYSNARIAALLQDLAPYDLAKAELLMIVNLRPGDAASLDAIVEEVDDRFDQAVQDQILAVVRRWIGSR